MAAVLADFEAVAKSHKNKQQNYNFRGVDDALRVLHPLLAKHKIYTGYSDMLAELSEFKTRNSTNFRCVVHGTVEFRHEDGSFVTRATVGEGADSYDKATMKAMANGLKYVIWYTFCVPTAEKKDSEAFDEPKDAPPKAGDEPDATGLEDLI